MSDVIITPLMSLTNPVPGSDTGPDYATNLYNSLNIVDGHNHSAGSGNPINTNGILINADLPFNTTYNATLLRSTRFAAQSSPLAGASDLGCLYVSGVDLWFNDVNGNQVRITSGAAVNATSSGISSGTASAAFSGGVLVVNSNTNTPANIQCGSVLIGNTTVSPNFVTVQAPTALASNYPFVLPTALPGAQKFMTLDSSGNLAAPWAVDNSTLEIATSTTVQVKNSGITNAKMASNSVDTSQLVAACVTTAKLASSLQLPGAPTVVAANRYIPGNNGAVDPPLGIIYGSVNSSGTKIAGNSYTPTKNSTGNYTIAFSQALASSDVSMVVTPVDSGGLAVGARITGFSDAGFTAIIVNASNNPVNVGFNFLVLGARNF